MKHKNPVAIAIVLSMGLMGLCPAWADTYRTNNVAGLVYLLKTYNDVNAANVIELEPGDYSLSASDSWYTDPSTYASLLYASKIRIRGCGEAPEDVKLIGDGTLRVIQITSNVVLENLTITNGHAAVRSGYDKAPRGGGVYGGGIVTNCLVTGNYAEKFGGGGAGDVKFRQCRLINNESGNAGGGFHGSSAYGTLIAGNVSAGDGGGVYTANLYDCEIVSNRNVNSSACGAGGFNVKYATNCVFAFNSALGSSSNGGGVANGSSEAVSANVLYGCTISNNWSSGNNGGAFKVTATNCTITMNMAAKSGGGAGACDLIGCEILMNAANNGGGGGVSSSTLTNCAVWANVCSNLTNTSYGGGINGCTAYDCDIYGNYARTCAGTDGKAKVGSAGGVYNSTLYDCRVHDNISDSYGGGVRDSTAVRCTISNNMSIGGADGPNAYDVRMQGCDVSGTGMYGGSATRSVFHDIGGMVELSDNIYFSTNMAVTMLWKGSMNVTNCLFRDNQLTNGSTKTLFQYASGVATSSSMVNCTVVSNSYALLFQNLTNTGVPMNVVNSVFFGNAVADFVVPSLASSQKCAIGALNLDRCAYATTSGSATIDNYVSGGAEVYQVESPRFQYSGDGSHPYSLKRSSPLIGKGLYSAWMAEATDIRGDGFPRAGRFENTGAMSVDIGCYQCLLPLSGFSLTIR